MAALTFFAEPPRQENPYAAPQTRDLVLPVAWEREALQATRTVEVIPRSTLRLRKAALVIYLISFLVPQISAGDWAPAAGLYYFFVGAVMCWHPLLFAWWANVFFGLSLRNIGRGRSQRACVYAGIGVLAAASFLVLGIDGDRFFFRIALNLPYLFWLAAMIVQWIAAVDMRQYNRNRVDEPFDRTVS